MMQTNAFSIDWTTVKIGLHQAFEKLLLPKSIIGILGRLVGALSMLALLKYGLQHGFSNTLELVIEYYEALLSVMFSWLEPLITALLNWIGGFVDIDFHLNAHWKHILILLWIYFVRDVATDFQRGFYGSASFLFVWGLSVALLASALSGSIRNSDWGASFSISFIPVLGAFVYTLMRRAWHATFLLIHDGETNPADLKGKSRFGAWWIAFRATFNRAAQRTIAGAIIIAACLFLPLIRNTYNSGVIIFAILIFSLATYWLWLGTRRAKDHTEDSGNWRQVYWDQSSSQMGASMMGVFFWSALFLLSNAGLRLIGL